METLIGRFDIYLQSAPLLAMPVAFLAGILTSFTPCVYPLIPITIGIIGAKGSESKLKGFYLSFYYILGLALIYAALGATAALTGSLFGQINTNKWTFLIVGNIFLFFGLSMLDVFSLDFALFQKWTPAFKESKGGFTAFIFGGISAFVAGPCTTPVLGVLLTYVASRQNIMFGFSMLFVFALGMGFLLIIVGTFTGLLASLPKSGGWMVKVKKGFGLLMILLAEFFIIKAGQLMF